MLPAATSTGAVQLPELGACLAQSLLARLTDSASAPDFRKGAGRVGDAAGRALLLPRGASDCAFGCDRAGDARQ